MLAKVKKTLLLWKLNKCCRWHKLQGYSFRWHHDHYNIHVMPGWELILTFMLLICALSIGRRILMGQGLVKQRWDRGWARLQMLQQHWKNVPGGGRFDVFIINWEYFSRFCSLGTRCDMFQYKASARCKYFPHLSMKDKSLYDVIQFTDDPKDAVYVMECASGRNGQVISICWGTFNSGMETNFVPNNDLLTHYNADWTGKAGIRGKK